MEVLDHSKKELKVRFKELSSRKEYGAVALPKFEIHVQILFAEKNLMLPSQQFY